MGVAVLDGAELLFWGVAGFRGLAGPAFLDTVERRLLDLIQTYEPQVLALEKPTPARLAASPMLGAIMSRISAVAVEQGLQVQSYSPDKVREQLCGSESATHNQLVERIVALYPHLARHRLKEGCMKEDYWRPMFAAVGVGIVAVQDGD